MLRVERLITVLVEIIVSYHQSKCGSPKPDDNMHVSMSAVIADPYSAEDQKDSEAKEDNSFLSVDVHYSESKSIDLAQLILSATEKDEKRRSLLNYLFHLIQLLKPLVINQRTLDKEASTSLQADVVSFVMNMQHLLKTQAPNSIIVNYEGHNIAICGFINELQDGGKMRDSGSMIRRICDSGSMIKNMLFPTLFPDVSPPVSASENCIKTAISDLFREFQFECLEKENAFLLTANAALQQKITTLLQQAKPKPIQIKPGYRFGLFHGLNLLGPYNFSSNAGTTVQNSHQVNDHDSDSEKDELECSK